MVKHSLHQTPSIFVVLTAFLLLLFVLHVQCHSPLPHSQSSLQLSVLLFGDDDNSDGENNNSAAAAAASSFSFSSSSSFESSSSVDEDDLLEEEAANTNNNRRKHHFLENVANWKPASFRRSECGPGKFRSVAGQCRQCSICGPDLYEREPCRVDQDTRCEWCLSGEAAGTEKSTEQKAEFDVKCAELVRIKEEFRRVLAATAKRSDEKVHQKQQQQQQQQFPSFQFASVELGGGNNSGWWKAEFAVQMAFYLALIALVLAIVRFLYKTKPMAGGGAGAYRAIQVHSAAKMPSAVLDELDQKQIIRAADAIRAKLGKKGYERLEEEFL